MVDDVSRLDVVEALPDTVTGVILRELKFATLVPSTLKFADRIVEVHCGYWTHDTQADLALFPNLTRLNVFGVSRSLSPLQKKLRRLQVNCSPYGKNPLAVFPSECASQTVLVYNNPMVFSFERSSPSPTNSASSVTPRLKASPRRISSRS